MKSLTIFKAFFTNSIIRDMEFRGSFFSSLLSHSVWIAAQISFFAFIFLRVDSIAGWEKNEMIFLLGTFLILDAIIFMLFIKNFSIINNYISNGELDIVLTKPVNSQFFVSLRYFNTMSFFDLFISLLAIIYAFSFLEIDFIMWKFFGYILLIMASVLTCYSVWLMSICSVFLFDKLTGVHQSFLEFWHFAKFPDVYKGFAKIAFLLLMPAIFAAYVPAGFYLEKISNLFVLIYVFISGTFFLLSLVVWKKCLRRYTSTGS